MRKSINPLTPTQVYRYAVQAFQPHLKLHDAKHVAAQTILTVLFAAAARISSLSDTCRQLRGVPDEHVVAEALYATLPDYNRLRRRRPGRPARPPAQGPAPPPPGRRPRLDVAPLLRRRPQDQPPRRARQGQERHLLVLQLWHGLRHPQGAALHHRGLTAMTRSMTLADLARELLQQVRTAGIKIRFLVLDREFYSVAVIRYLQAARTPFLMPVVCHGRPADHPLGPSGSNVFKQCQKSGWSEPALTDATKAPGDGLDLRQVPESPRRAWQARSRGLDLCLLGDPSETVRLGQRDVPASVRDRDQLSPNEPMPDSDDDGTVRGTVLVRGDRVLAAGPVGLASSRGALPPSSRWTRISPQALAA